LYIGYVVYLHVWLFTFTLHFDLTLPDYVGWFVTLLFAFVTRYRLRLGCGWILRCTPVDCVCYGCCSRLRCYVTLITRCCLVTLLRLLRLRLVVVVYVVVTFGCWLLCFDCYTRCLRCCCFTVARLRVAVVVVVTFTFTLRFTLRWLLVGCSPLLRFNGIPVGCWLLLRLLLRLVTVIYVVAGFVTFWIAVGLPRLLRCYCYLLLPRLLIVVYLRAVYVGYRLLLLVTFAALLLRYVRLRLFALLDLLCYGLFGCCYVVITVTVGLPRCTLLLRCCWLPIVVVERLLLLLRCYLLRCCGYVG